MRVFRDRRCLLRWTLSGCIASALVGLVWSEPALAQLPPVQPPPCVPAPPINPIRCNPEEPVPPTPPVLGECRIEVFADSVGFYTGQGWLEGRAEASVGFTVTDSSTGAVVQGRYPSTGSVKMVVDADQVVSVKLGSYVVEERDTLDLNVCASFAEYDKLDKDDVGADCQTVTLRCPQRGVDVPLRADLCRGGDCSKLKGLMTANIRVLAADADRDCVENEHDYTPEPCDEAFKGQLCRSSLVYFHYGDGVLNDLAQNLGTDLRPAMTGYDRVVLLIDDDHVGPYNLNPDATTLADGVMLPTEANFFAAMQDLTSSGCDIDVWIFSHGSPDWVSLADLSAVIQGGSIAAMEDDEHHFDATQIPDITTDELAEDTAPENSGTPAVPIRMTYGTACFYSLWNDTWRAAGAKVTSGAIEFNFVPNYFGRFADNWAAGQNYGTSLNNESSVAAEQLAFQFINLSQGALPPWLCVGDSVLGKNPCAEHFFNDTDALPFVDQNGEWLDGPDEAKYAIGGPRADLEGIVYDANLSGADNMRRASVKVLRGDPNTRKNQPPTLVWP